MRTLAADHLILDVTTSDYYGQWYLSVSNYGVVLAQTYGSLPVPGDDELRERARRMARCLPQTVWGYG